MTNYRALFPGCCLLLLLLSLSACGGPDTPLDANTRQKIDSTSAAQIRLARAEMDSFCAVERKTTLPHFIDSIKQKRLEEIRQLRTARNPEAGTRPPK